MTAIDLRPSPIAGTWYDGNPTRLAKQVDAYLQKAHPPALEGHILGVIAPHAGYVYSGITAGYAFKPVQGMDVDLVVIFSPLHAYHPAPFLTTAHQGYQTPLGSILVDQDVLRRVDVELCKISGVRLTAVHNDPEHSLEIELPFLQRTLNKEFKLLPIMVRTHAPDLLCQLGKIIAGLIQNKKCLLVASTDLSHFKTEQVAHQYDSVMLEAIQHFSPEEALQAEQTGTGFACGVGAVAAMLWTARFMGATSVQILHHSTSAETTGDRSSVVGYGAAVVLKQE